MINKVLMSGYNNSGLFPPAAIIPQFSKGLDKSILHKRASIFENEYDKFERKPKHTYIHLISVAAGEQYGPNSRADFYNGDSYRHDFTEPEKNGPTFIILDGGIKKYHKTFMTNGGCYTEHFSDCDGAKPQGYIVAEKFNPDMQRGELIIGVKTDEWADDIQKLEKDIPMKFSIGALTSSDRCSYCGHVAHTEDEHCDHYKNNRGVITADGSQVYVITDNCVYHDISRVKNPAEKIAFSIKKVANADSDNVLWAARKPELTTIRSIVKTASGRKRLDTLTKLAAIEKKIIAEANSGALDKNIIAFFKKRKNMNKDANSGAEQLRNFLDFADEKQLLGALKQNKSVLSTDDFINLFVSPEDQEACHICSNDIDSRLPGMFSNLLHCDDVDSFCEDDMFEPGTCSPMCVARVRNCSRSIPELSSDVLNTILGGIPEDDLQSCNKIIILSTGHNKSAADIIAKLYANYMLSATSDFSPEELTMTLLDRLIG